MAIDGIYDVEVSMPEGKRSLKISLKAEGKSLSGTIDGPFGKHGFSGGSVTGNDAAWTVVLKPGSDDGENQQDDSEGGFLRKLGRFISDSLSESLMEVPSDFPKNQPTSELPVDFKARVTGDEIAGEMKFWDYATGTFKGARSSE